MKGWHRWLGYRFACSRGYPGHRELIGPRRRPFNGYGPWVVFIVGHALGVWVLVAIPRPATTPEPRSRSVHSLPSDAILATQFGAQRQQVSSRFPRPHLGPTAVSMKDQPFPCSDTARRQQAAYLHSPDRPLVQVTPPLDSAVRLDPVQLRRFEQQRSRLQAELLAQGQTWLTSLVLQPSDTSTVRTGDVVGRIQALATLELQVQAEVWATQQWQQAIHFASQAAMLGNLRQPTLSTWYRAKTYWQSALVHLRQIPAESERRQQVLRKYEEYRHNLDVARYRSELWQSGFLRTIAAQAQLSPQTRITVCRVGGECRHYGGNAIVVSPASLIKIPVAIAVLQQLQQGTVSLGTPIRVTPGNFTEDPAEIQVGKTYPLQVLLSQMLSHSSNIATNQLIDYLGWDRINQSLQQAGYRFTRVNFKLMGQSWMPANPGRQANTLTSDELSRMMQQIYQGDSPGHQVVRQALANQQDRELGIRALAANPGLWVGEKTGRTAVTLGTTLAMQLQGNLYIVTIVDQTGKGERELRQGIQAVATYLEQGAAL